MAFVPLSGLLQKLDPMFDITITTPAAFPRLIETRKVDIRSNRCYAEIVQDNG
jgi:hypothetical protein